MRLGNFEVTSHVLGKFRLDGGAMFGSVPKNLWSKKIPPDNENCIPLVTRSIVIRPHSTSRVFLVDVGMGEKWDEKARSIFAIENLPVAAWGFNPAEITDVILTHLHFDHAGGVSHYAPDGQLALTYPHATHYLQTANLNNAQMPSLKERASYLKENYEPLSRGALKLLNGKTEIFPGIWVHQVDGHTIGQQIVEITSDNHTLLFMTDLVPTAHHLPTPYHMGYDACAQTVLKEKEYFLNYALEHNAIVLFEHDATTAAGYLKLDPRGQFAIRELCNI